MSNFARYISKICIKAGNKLNNIGKLGNTSVKRRKNRIALFEQSWARKVKNVPGTCTTIFGENGQTSTDSLSNCRILTRVTSCKGLDGLPWVLTGINTFL